MRALRSSKHTLALALIAFAAIGVPAFAAPRTEPAVGSVTTTIGHGVIRAVDATMVDSVDTRAGRTDRHAPRNHGLPHLVGPAHFALAAAGEKPDEIRLPPASDPLPGQLVHQGMADVGGLQPGVFENRFLEREKAEHLVEEFNHLRDAFLVPCPDLGADVIDLFRIR